jgi:arsenical pump membrane protein
MPLLTAPHAATWVIAGIATLGVILRPFRWPEAVWAVSGAVILVAAGLLPWMDAVRAVGKGGDVYLFLTGMMLLAEMARAAGLFGHVAARAARRAAGDPRRLFTLVYGVGVVVTVFLSNDATAVVLTPAVFAVARAARAEPLPYLLICAFIANAASFVLPISNPANLVVFGSAMPPLLSWLGRFGLPSIFAIVATYAVLRFTQRAALVGAVAQAIDVPPLSRAGRTVAWGIGGTAAALMLASGFGVDLGWPTCLAAVLTAAAIAVAERAVPWAIVKGVSWAVLPLVAGLFVLVEGIGHTGVLAALSDWLHGATGLPAAWGLGAAVAVLCNLVNNLPAGLLVGSAIGTAHLPPQVATSVLIGVDLGPNLSVTGSLATILWLVALRREGMRVGFWQFLKLGALVMPPALLLALGAVALTR